MAENKQNVTLTPRKGRVGNFLVKEEIISTEEGENLSRLHISDLEGGWEVVIPQHYASAYNILASAFDSEGNKPLSSALHVLMENFFLTTTCMDAGFHALLRDIAVIGFTPAVSKMAIKRRKAMRKNVYERMKYFEFPQYTKDLDEEEERQAEIAHEVRDIIETE